jgi:hypothetical protein
MKEARNYLEDVTISIGHGSPDEDYEKMCAARAVAMAAEFRSACRFVHTGRGVDCSELVSRFVNRRPPFSKDKPDEFKDAVAALSLRAWIEESIRRRPSVPVGILVISDDGDWDAICQDIPGLTKTNLGAIMARVEELREGLLISLSRDAIIEALRTSLFEDELVAFLERREVYASFLEVPLKVEEVAVQRTDFHVEKIRAINASEILAVVQFSADIVVDWEAVDLGGDEEEIRGVAEVSVSSDGEVEHVRILECGTIAYPAY